MGGKMSLEPCPICGYAVSSVTGECRHCPASFAEGFKSRWSDAPFLLKAVLPAVALGILAYWILKF
jgi:hypothetical protein